MTNQDQGMMEACQDSKVKCCPSAEAAAQPLAKVCAAVAQMQGINMTRMWAAACLGVQNNQWAELGLEAKTTKFVADLMRQTNMVVTSSYACQLAAVIHDGQRQGKSGHLEPRLKHSSS